MGDQRHERLQQRYPAWHIWRSGGGSWLATRRGVLTDEQMLRGLYHTLMESTAVELHNALAEQTEIEDRSRRTA